jgi:hypothetical protein
MNLVITTTGVNSSRSPLLRDQQRFSYALLLPGFLGIIFAAGQKHVSRNLALIGLIVLLAVSVFWVACGSGTTSEASLGRKSTPVGTYSIAISAANGTLRPSTTITLSVQ